MEQTANETEDVDVCCLYMWNFEGGKIRHAEQIIHTRAILLEVHVVSRVSQRSGTKMPSTAYEP